MEESGWKLVHGDVFRPPKAKQLLAALVGTGIQIFAMAVITISKSRPNNTAVSGMDTCLWQKDEAVS